jgi:hypothetical protein
LAPAIGIAVFALDPIGLRSSAPGSSPTVTVSSEQIARLRRSWTDERGHAPDAAEERQIVADAIDDAILHRAALDFGLDRGDRSVQKRLADLGTLLAQAGDAEPSVNARSHGFERTDPVIAAHLADVLRLGLAKTDAEDLPNEAQLAAYYERNAERFAQPPRLRFTHVFLARERHGASIEADAARVLRELSEHAPAAREAAKMGDAFVHGAELGPLPPQDIARLFGPAFASAIEGAPARQWMGPVSSPYGLHLVYVNDRLAGRVPALDAVRSRVVHAYVRERAEAKLRERMNSLRARYRVEIADASAASGF